MVKAQKDRAVHAAWYPLLTSLFLGSDVDFLIDVEALHSIALVLIDQSELDLLNVLLSQVKESTDSVSYNSERLIRSTQDVEGSAEAVKYLLAVVRHPHQHVVRPSRPLILGKSEIDPQLSPMLTEQRESMVNALERVHYCVTLEIVQLYQPQLAYQLLHHQMLRLALS